MKIYRCIAVGLVPMCVALGGVSCRTAKPVGAPAHTVEKLSAGEQLDALLDELWQLNMRRYPTWATYEGVRRYDDRLTDLSESAREEHLAKVEELARQVAALPADDLEPMDRDTQAMVQLAARQMRAEEVCRGEWWEVDGLGGPQVDYPMMPVFFTIRNDEDVENLEKRYRATAKQVAQITEQLEEGVANGYAPTKTNLGRALKQLDEFLETPLDENPMLKLNLADGVAAPDDSGLRGAIETVVMPALRDYRDVLRDVVLPAARPDRGIADLPTGEECYAARMERHIGPGYTADELHERGLEELARLHAGMVQVGIELGMEDPTAREVMEFVSATRANWATTEQEILEKNTAVVERAKAAMPRAFGRLPKTPVEVRPIEPHRAKDAPAAYYYSAPEEGSRPAYYYVNTVDPQTRALFNLEALAFHEAIPGHHLQIALAQELPDVHIWRRNAGQTAFVEGWALYAEMLADELGLYSDPLTRFGMYNYQAWRAARLVVDTGLHSRGWSRQRAIEFMSESVALPENEIANEIDRYIAWPGQALAYMVGRMKIQELRANAREALGDAHSLKRYNDAVNARGAVPLTILEANISDWVERMKTSTSGLPDFRDIWNFDDPAATHAKFEALLQTDVVKEHPTYRRQLVTQIARTHSLRGAFEEAHATLDEVEAQLRTSEPVVEVRYHLERGRTFNSAKQPEKAKPHFTLAWEVARRAGIDGLAVDAAHMMGIAEKGDAAMAWNQRALELAETSDDPAAKRWLGALYNNIGWSLHDAGEFDEALEVFERAQAWREERGEVKPLRVAKWSVARAMRSVGRYDDALAIQQALEKEWDAAGAPDGFVYEELAELHLVRGERAEAKKYFALAHPLLAELGWVDEKRLARIAKLGGL